MTRTPIPNCPQPETPIRERAWTDEQRLDRLQEIVDSEGALLLHNGAGKGSGFCGFGLANLGRTLRQAIDSNLDTDAPKREISTGAMP